MGRNFRRDDRDSGNNDFNRFSNFNRGGQNMGPREMHKATCAECENECEVPFKPREGRPVYCRECFQKHKTKRF